MYPISSSLNVSIRSSSRKILKFLTVSEETMQMVVLATIDPYTDSTLHHITTKL